MFLDACIFMIVEAGALELSVRQFETERFDQMQADAAVRTQAYNISGIGRYFGLVENDVEHDSNRVKQSLNGIGRA